MSSYQERNESFVLTLHRLDGKEQIIGCSALEVMHS